MNIEAEFHKRIKRFLDKQQQAWVMQEMRQVMNEAIDRGLVTVYFNEQKRESVTECIDSN